MTDDIGKSLREKGFYRRYFFARTEREEAEAEQLHDQEPGRWGDHASPARMKRERARNREEDR